jgi:hypothetical protein
MASSNAGKQALFVELDVFHGLEGQGVVSKQAVDAKQANDAKVPEHLVQRTGSKFIVDLAI